MIAVRRAALVALVVACMHSIFGAIVRISGSGMGCGDNWPKCYGYWFPPMSRPDLIVEVSHRYLASILVIAVGAMLLVAWRHRADSAGAGPGGTLRSSAGAAVAVLAAAILGGVTVKLGNTPLATLAHWLVAMTLLALIAATAIRAGALGGARTLVERGSARTVRGAAAAAVLAIAAVAMGGLTAKYPGAAVACVGFPECARNPDVPAGAVRIQLIHRALALLLALHLSGMIAMLTRRRDTEAPLVLRAAYAALALVVLQFVIAASMILLRLPPALRSLHEATGLGIWLTCFTFAYLAIRGASGEAPRTSDVSALVARTSPLAPARAEL